MSSFNWVGGDLDQPSSWEPQPDPPAEPQVPGTTDLVTIGGGGPLVGPLNVADASIVGGIFQMQGAISVVDQLSFSLVSGSTATDLTIESGASFTTAGEDLGGAATAAITQLGGENLQTNGTIIFGIAGGSSYDLEGGTLAAASYISLGGADLSNQPGVITQSGGTAYALGILADLGTYDLQGGTFIVGTGNEYLGQSSVGHASFIQSDGTHTINSELIVGYNGAGTYTLSGGLLSSDIDFIGQYTEGTFIQTGGTNIVSDRIVLGINVNPVTGNLGNGTYTLGGDGTVSVNTVFIGSDPDCVGVFNFNTAVADAAKLTILGTEGIPGLIIGGEGSGTFNQGSGSIDTTIEVGRKSTGTGIYNLTNGTLTSTSELVGSAGNGTVTQDDGINDANGAGLIVGSLVGAKGQYNLNDGTLNAVSMTIGDAGSGGFTQTGGTANVFGVLIVGNSGTGVVSLRANAMLAANAAVTLGAQASGNGTIKFNTDVTDTANFTMVDGSSTVQTLTIGDKGTGAFIQGGGTINTVLEIAAQAGSNGSYELDDGVLRASNETVGDAGTGTFVQKGGTNAVAGQLTVDNNGVGSQYTLGGTGTLTTGSGITIGNLAGSNGTFSFNEAPGDAATLLMPGQTLIVGNAGTGEFDQGGGTLNAAVEIVGKTGTGNFTLDGGTNIVAGTLTVGAAAGSSGDYIIPAKGGTLTVAKDEVIGDAGTGGFNQSDGSNIISGNLIVGNSGAGPSTFIMTKGTTSVTGNFTAGAQANAVASVTLGGGELTANNEAIGDAGTGTVNQVGGSNTANGDAVIGNTSTAANGYMISGGTFAVTGNLSFGSQSGANGTFTQTGGTVVAGSETFGDAGKGLGTQTGGSNTATNGLTVGNVGSGTLTLGGSAQLNVQTGDLVLGQASGASGTVNFNINVGDAATITMGSGVIQDGYAGTGSFNQISGTLTAKVIVGSQFGSTGNYKLQAGQLSSLGQVVGNDGKGTFTQNGGANDIAGGGDLLVGVFNFGVGTYKLNDGTLVAGGEIMGEDGQGQFTQAGGTNVVLVGTTSVLALGVNADGTGAYALNSGTLSVGGPSVTAGNASIAGQEIIGDAGTGNFVQKGGTNIVTGDVLIGVSNDGTYTMSGGTLIVQANTQDPNPSITLGQKIGGTGTLHVTNGTITTPFMNIGNAGTAIVNADTAGAILVANTLAIASGSQIKVGKGSIAVGGSVVGQTGAVEIGAGGVLSGAGLINAGLVIDSGGSVLANGGLLEVKDAVSGTGTLLLTEGSALQFDTSPDNQQAVVFDAGTIETLILNAPSIDTTGTGPGNFSSVTGISPGDLIELGQSIAINSVSLATVGTLTNVDIAVTGSSSSGFVVLNDISFLGGADRFVTGTDAVTGNAFIEAAAPPCFLSGTHIDTIDGPVAVEALHENALVPVLLGRCAMPVRWIGRRSVDCARHPKPEQVWPVRVAANAFGRGSPRRTLYLSPDHAVYVDGALIPAKHLINGDTIVQQPMDRVTYYHVELPRHEVLWAEGLAVESYLDTGDRSGFENGGGPLALYPDFASRAWEADGCAPMIVTGPRLDAVRHWLAQLDPPARSYAQRSGK
jgi:Hint domain